MSHDKSITYDKISDITEEEDDGMIPISTYVNAFRRCVHLRKIRVLGDVMEYFTDSDFQRLEEFGPLISTLYLETQRQDEQLTSQGFSSFLRCCPQLVELKCHGIDTEDAVILHRLGEMCHQLNSISLVRMYDITNDSFLALLQGCPKLTAIKISYASHFGQLNLTDAIFGHHFNPLLKEIDLRISGVRWDQMTVATCFSQCHELEVCKVVWGCVAGGLHAGGSISDTGLTVLAEGCPKLREIKLYSSPLLTINGLMQLCETRPLISKITIIDRGPPFFHHHEICAFQRRFPSITIKAIVDYFVGHDSDSDYDDDGDDVDDDVVDDDVDDNGDGDNDDNDDEDDLPWDADGYPDEYFTVI